MDLSLVRSVFAVAFLFADPVLAARLQPTHKAALGVESSTVDSTLIPELSVALTPEPTPDVDALVDVTAAFEPSNKVITVDDASYMCCCRSVGPEDIEKLQMILPYRSIACEIVDSVSKPVYAFKKGCGGLKGDGWHSWNTMVTILKYASFDNVGKCAVTAQQAELLEAAPTPDPTPDVDALVDVTAAFEPSNKVITVDDASYMCCCRSVGPEDIEKLQMILPYRSIACEILDSVKKGCGGLKGDGWHSWNTMVTLSKYASFDNVGKCVVTAQQAELLAASEALVETDAVE